MNKVKVAFVCTHNSCRSQIAEAIARTYAGDAIEPHSAGTRVAPRINPDAVRMMKALHGVDMTLLQRPKTLDGIPAVDVLVTMGCGVVCPFVSNRHEEDWGLDDPTGKGDAAMAATIRLIEEKVADLAERIRTGRLRPNTIR